MKKAVKTMQGVTDAINERMNKIELSRYRLANDLAPKVNSNGPAMSKRLLRIWESQSDLSLDLVISVLDEIGLKLTIEDKK